MIDIKIKKSARCGSWSSCPDVFITKLKQQESPGNREEEEKQGMQYRTEVQASWKEVD